MLNNIKSHILKINSTFRVDNSLKNILIFLPFFLSNKAIEFVDVYTLTIGFLIFSIVTSVCYVTNNFIDRAKDKINKLKSKVIILDKKTVIFLNVSLIVTILLISDLTNYINIHLVLYLSIFYCYNFFLKSLFLIDICTLIFFYIIRLFYGAELIDINISNWFLIFFIPTFGVLAIFKRMIQISRNKLLKKNKIIIYSSENLSLLKKIVVFFLTMKLIIFVLYLYEMNYPNTFDYLSSKDTKYYQNNYFLILTFCGYIYWMSRLVNMVFNKLIKNDIYHFIINDKLSYLLFFVFFIIIAFSN